MIYLLIITIIAFAVAIHLYFRLLDMNAGHKKPYYKRWFK